MKLQFFFLLLVFNFTAFSQADWEIKLSKSMPETRMGKWVVGDYTVLISLDTIAVMLRKEQESMIKAIAYYGDQDSNLVNYYKASAKRYDIAATQLEQAKYGFDLQSLNIDTQEYEKDTFSFYRSLLKSKHYGSKIYRQFYWKMEN